MGDIADMMLEGVLCEGCGVYLSEGHGFPGLCAGCAKDYSKAGSEIRDTGLGYYQDVTPIAGTKGESQEKILCKYCNKSVKRVGMLQHVQAKHSQEHDND